MSYPTLERIQSPHDLRRLDPSELPTVCQELRDYLIEVASAKGGHFAPNLGVVELTVALHYALDTPRDRIVWDVGHQSYPHKVLTGRREALRAVKQYGGISGYPKREESPFDHFGVGHASTSISAALAMAVARDAAGEDYAIVTVTGDGAMTGGVAYEGLNNAGASGRNLLVILNDNKMSIAPSVGAIARYLADVTSNPRWNWFKRWRQRIAEKLPFGERALGFAEKVEGAIKHFLVPVGLFEALGFRYFGPIDGHDLPELVKVIRNLRQVAGPVLLHVSTVKGKGYAIAEESPEAFHGVTPFRRDNGEFLKTAGAKLDYSTVFGRTVVELAGIFPDLYGITAAMSSGTGLCHLEASHPDRFFDVGIAEQHAVTFSAGLAAAGKRPVAAVYSTFLQRAFDQIVHDVALQGLPVVFCIDRAGLVGEDGPTHHGAFDISYLRLMPNMVVAAPSSGAELRNLLYTALLRHEGPFAIRYPRASTELEEMPEGGFEEVPVGTWDVLREGQGLHLLAVGSMVPVALEAAEELGGEGLRAGVVNCRFIKPLDRERLRELAREGTWLVPLEEGALPGGFGAAVEEALEEEGLNGVRVLRRGLPDRFITHGSRGRLLEEVGLVPVRIAEAVRRAVAVAQGHLSGGS